MHDNTKIRKLIREHLLNEIMGCTTRPDKVYSDEELNSYVQEQLDIFNEKIIKLTKKYNHPFIQTALRYAVYSIENDIEKGNCRYRGFKELYML